MQNSPSFDTWTSLFLVASVMGVFLFVSILLTKNKKSFPIAFLVLAFSLILFQYVLFWTGFHLSFPYLRLLPHLCYYTIGPLLYLYFLHLFKKQVTFYFPFHFIPAFLVLITYTATLLNNLNITESIIPWKHFSNNPWLISAHLLIYAILIVRLIQGKSTETEYKKLRQRWSKVLVCLFISFTLAYISYYILINFPFFKVEWDYSISIVMTFSVYTIGFFIIKQPEVFNGGFFTELFLPDKSKESSFEESMLNEFFFKLTQFMEKEKPFTDNELRLVNVADSLGFSTHLLSKVINKKSGKNFNQFINDYRLQEARRLLIENPEYSIKMIYFEVGFNNKVTFYNAFKKEFDCTPTQFRENSLST